MYMHILMRAPHSLLKKLICIAMMRDGKEKARKLCENCTDLQKKGCIL